LPAFTLIKDPPLFRVCPANIVSHALQAITPGELPQRSTVPEMSRSSPLQIIARSADNPIVGNILTEPGSGIQQGFSGRVVRFASRKI